MGRIDAWDELSLGTNCRLGRIVAQPPGCTERKSRFAYNFAVQYCMMGSSKIIICLEKSFLSLKMEETPVKICDGQFFIVLFFGSFLQMASRKNWGYLEILAFLLD